MTVFMSLRKLNIQIYRSLNSIHTSLFTVLPEGKYGRVNLCAMPLYTLSYVSSCLLPAIFLFPVGE